MLVFFFSSEIFTHKQTSSKHRKDYIWSVARQIRKAIIGFFYCHLSLLFCHFPKSYYLGNFVRYQKPLKFLDCENPIHHSHSAWPTEPTQLIKKCSTIKKGMIGKAETLFNSKFILIGSNLILLMTIIKAFRKST